LSFHFRVGTKLYKKFGLELEASPATTITTYEYFAGKVSSYAAKVLYYF
jgi:hypothetical protein